MGCKLYSPIKLYLKNCNWVMWVWLILDFWVVNKYSYTWKSCSTSQLSVSLFFWQPILHILQRMKWEVSCIDKVFEHLISSWCCLAIKEPEGVGGFLGASTHYRLALRFHNLSLIPVCCLCFGFEFEDGNPQLPSPAAGCCTSLTVMDSPSGSWSHSKSFLI